MITTNIFTEQYEEFKNTRLAQRLENKFTPKPYYKKYKLLMWVALVASYLFNIFSGLTASTLVFFFTYQLTDFLIPSIVITVVLLVLLECSKRLTATPIFKDYLQYKKINKWLVIVALVLSGLSIGFSFFGSKKTVNEFTPQPQLIEVDSLTTPLKERIVQLDSQVKQARQTKWKGTTTSKSQEAITVLTQQITNIQSEILRIQQDTDQRNLQTLTEHKNQTMVNSNHFALVTLLFEFLFLLSAFYIEYFDYRSYSEFSMVHSLKPKQSNGYNLKKQSKKTSQQLRDKPELPEVIEDLPERYCLNCMKGIIHKRKDAKFCSEKCRREKWTQKNGREPFLRPSK